MAGINLSQTGDEAKVEAGFFDKGVVTSLILLSITLAVFGGLRWYAGSLEDQSAALDQELALKKTELSGEKVNRLADFDSRLKYVEQMKMHDAANALSELEAAIIPTVVVSKFLYDSESGRASFTASTSTFKSLAQQIQTIKGTNSFTEVYVDEIKRTPEGGIIFSLAARLASDTK